MIWFQRAFNLDKTKQIKEAYELYIDDLKLEHETYVKDLKDRHLSLLNAKNRNLSAFKNMADAQSDVIESYADQMKKYAKIKNEDRILDAVIENAPMILNAVGLKVPFSHAAQTSKPISTPSIPEADPQQTLAPQLESGRQYSDEEITKQLKRAKTFTPNDYNAAFQGGEQVFIDAIKANIADISEESANRAYVLAKELTI